MVDEVVLLNTWFSPFGMRVRIALAEKGVKYEYKEENLLTEKSPLLLKSNPIHEKIPVLIHNGRPICESLIIVQYIDEVWKDTAPLLPLDPYQRANAKFWADFADKKIYDIVTRIWKNKGEEQEAAKKEFIECMKLFEGELAEKPYFGGESFGFVDIALIPFSTRFYTCEVHGNFRLKECPKLMAWVKRCKGRESVSKVLADPHKVREFVCTLKKKFGIE